MMVIIFVWLVLSVLNIYPSTHSHSTDSPHLFIAISANASELMLFPIARHCSLLVLLTVNF